MKTELSDKILGPRGAGQSSNIPSMMNSIVKGARLWLVTTDNANDSKIERLYGLVKILTCLEYLWDAKKIKPDHIWDLKWFSIYSSLKKLDELWKNDLKISGNLKRSHVMITSKNTLEAHVTWWWKICYTKQSFSRIFNQRFPTPCNHSASNDWDSKRFKLNMKA